jgi:hypothetical protein
VATLPSVLNPGCDSTVTLVLTVNPIQHVEKDTTEATICSGETFKWTQTGKDYTATGIYRDTVVNATSCDSLFYTLNLTVNERKHIENDTLSIRICNGDRYKWDQTGDVYNATGIYRDTVTTATSCDSLFYTLNLTVLGIADTVKTEATVCFNGDYEWLDKEGQQLKKFESLTASKDDTVRLAYAGLGCDSLVYTLRLTVMAQTDTVRLAPVVCEGDDYDWLDEAGAKLKSFTKIAEDIDDTIRVKFADDIDCLKKVYILNLKVNKRLADVATDVHVCAAELPYVWKVDDRTIGSFTASGDYHDTVKYVATGCDSISYTLNLFVHQKADTVRKSDFVCDGAPYEWRDKQNNLIKSYASVTAALKDTVALPYAQAGCDSIVHILALSVDKIEVFDYNEYKVYFGYTYTSVGGRKFVITKDTTIYEYDQNIRGCDSVEYAQKVTVLAIPKAERSIRFTVCAGDTYVAAGGPRVITGDSTWVDSVRFELKTPVDSFFTYNIYTFRSPSTLPDTLINSVRAVCGSPLDTLTAQTRIEQYLNDNFWDIHVDPASTIQWFVSRAGSYVSGASNILSGAQGEVDFKVVITDGCGQSGEFSKVIPVEDPGAEFQDNILVSKFGQWLLMLHVNNLIKAGYVFTEDDIDWYQIVNGVETKLDNHGYSYTINEELVGTFYVIIHTASEFGCNTTIRSNTINWSAPSNAPLRLVPNIGVEGTVMRLENLNPSNEYQIYGYNESGSLVTTMSVSGQAVAEIRAEGSQGLYMLRVVTDDKQETLRYIIK